MQWTMPVLLQPNKHFKQVSQRLETFLRRYVFIYILKNKKHKLTVRYRNEESSTEKDVVTFCYIIS